MPKLTVKLFDATSRLPIGAVQFDLPAVQEAGYAQSRILDLFDRLVYPELIERQLRAEPAATALQRVAWGQPAELNLVVDHRRPEERGSDLTRELQARDACLTEVQSWLAQKGCPLASRLSPRDYKEAFGRVNSLMARQAEETRAARFALDEVKRVLLEAGIPPDDNLAHRLTQHLAMLRSDAEANADEAAANAAQLKAISRQADTLQTELKAQTQELEKARVRIRQLEDRLRGAVGQAPPADDAPGEPMLRDADEPPVMAGRRPL